MRRPILLALFLLAPAIALAQRDKQDLKRPLLPPNADTNDARAYYDFGLDQIRSNPKVAASAFYWASLLEPTSADAFYARRVALLLTDPDRLSRYWAADRNTLKRAEIKAIDSLYLHSLTLNPFFYEMLERHLQDAVIDNIIRRATMGTSATPTEVRYQIDQYLRQLGPGESAFRAYNDGRFAEALKQYARAIKESKYKHYYRRMRGRLFFQLGNVDSALTELTLAVEELRKRDAKDLVYVYESKELLEHSIGMAYERLGKPDKAREAYGRALQEDLGYSPAHVRLGYMAIESGDTTTALSEFDLAVQLRPEDSGLRYQYGWLLAEARHDADAETQMKKALELNPWFSSPHFGLGRMYARQGKKAEAVQQLTKFLAVTSRRDPRLDEATQLLESVASK